ncbi:hypothetical protein [Micromonospora sp. NPDC002717]|uniref:hypothetical protein n=1 Tax=Micromonospora sp. NPDC002717 TaxID=3154424 RepID=UPI00332D28A7
MAIPDHIKQQIVKNIDKKRDKTLSKLREVLDYPYHPDTKILIFRVEGDSGAYGMNLLAANEHWDMIEVNADGEDLYGTRFLHFGFNFYVLEDCDVSPARTSLPEQISKFTRDYLYPWFADRFEELGGKDRPFDCVLQKHDTLRGFSMKERKWIKVHPV